MNEPSECLVISKFRVANGMAQEVAAAFVNRPHLVEQHQGFLRMEVVRPQDEPDEFWLMTWWISREAFAEWHHGHTYRESHAGIPAGLKLVPAATELRYFTRVTN